MILNTMSQTTDQRWFWLCRSQDRVTIVIAGLTLLKSPIPPGATHMDNEYPLIKTKVRTPRRQQTLLRRERLVNYLHSNIHNKLILISAGAGYGKTSLLIDYAHDADLPVCWYSLDANDRYVPTFVEYLVASIRQRFPDFGEATLSMLRHHTGPAEAVEPFVRMLVHEIEETVSHYFVIILDDYHEVLDSEPVNALVDGLLRYLPEHCHVILASRGIPRRLTLTRLAARQEVVGLGVEHLRFTAPEIEMLLHKLGRDDFTREQIDLLAKRSEGWITGVLLTAQAGLTGIAQDVLEISGTTEGVFEFMAGEILERQPEDVQRFLLGSALFNEMTPPLCDALLEIDNSAHILRDLAAQNLFTTALDAEGLWYQYHQLFREFLVAKLRQDDPLTYQQLSLRQAEIMVHEGHWPRAIEGYLQGQAFEEAAQAIQVVAQDTFDAGNWDTLRKWIDALPEAILAEHPTLLLFRAKIHSETGEPIQALDLLDRSYTAYLAHHDIMGAARALVQRGIVQRMRGRHSEAIETCRQILDTIGDEDCLPRIQAYHTLGICQTIQGDYDEGMRSLEAALQIAERMNNDTEAAYIAHDMGTAELNRGHPIRARRHYHQALMCWRRLGNSSALASTLQGLGIIHQYTGQYAEAEDRFQESLAKARSAADRRLEAYALANQGDLYRDTGHYDKALEAYRQAIEVAATAQATGLMFYLLATQGITHCLKGEPEHARATLLEAMDGMRESEMPYEAGLCYLGLGMVALAQKDATPPEAAHKHLDRAQALFEQIKASRELARTHLYQAMRAHRIGSDDLFRAHMEQVARLSAEMGSYQFILGEGQEMTPLLHAAAEIGIKGLDYVRLNAEMARLYPSATPAARVRIVQSPATLEFLGLNGGQVRKNGEIVTDWESSTARIMAFLFASHPRGLSRDRVIDMLWPEASQARGNGLFHSTVYRMRSSLSREIIIHEKGIYRINPEAGYRYDVAQFQRLARLGRTQGEPAHIARVEAIDLYRTPFLEACDHEWCYNLRHVLHNDMIDLLLLEAHYLIDNERIDEAEPLYMRVLSLDSYDERAHRGIMWCRARRNDRAGALRQFRECQRILQDELSVDPSEQTLHLHESILEGSLTLLPMPN